MSDAKLAAQLPKGEGDGLSAIAPDLVRDPHRKRVVMAIVDCKKVTTDHDTGDIFPVARIRRIEVLSGDDLSQAERLMRRALEKRSGDTVLPLDLEDELHEAFQNVDPTTGEKLG